jgi:hypothetical protein
MEKKVFKREDLIEPVKVDAFAARINSTWGKVLEGIIAVGHELEKAFNSLGSTDYDQLLEMLPFGERAAEKIRWVVRDKRLMRKSLRKKLPPCWSTLYEMTRWRDHEFESALKKGVIRRSVTRNEVIGFKLGTRQKETPVGGGIEKKEVLALVMPSDIDDPSAAIDIMFIAMLCKAIFARPWGQPSIHVRYCFSKDIFKHHEHWLAVMKIIDAEEKVASELYNLVKRLRGDSANPDDIRPKKFTGTSSSLGLMGITQLEIEESGSLFAALLSKQANSVGISCSFQELVAKPKVLKKVIKDAERRVVD